MTLYGNLSFTASRDLGDAGPLEGTPVTYHWSLWWNLAVLAPWLILLLLLLRPKNANVRAWMILIPVLILAGPLLLLELLVTLSEVSQLLPLLTYLETARLFVLGLAALWLLSDTLGGLSRPRAFFAALGILGVMGLVGALSVGGFSLDASLAGALGMYAVGAAAILVGTPLAGFCCRKNYSPTTFTLWLLLWAPGTVAAVVSCLILIMAVSMFMSIGEVMLLLGMIFASVVCAGVTAVLIAGILAPFMILTFWNRLYRERFYAIFRLQGMEDAPAQE